MAKYTGVFFLTKVRSCDDLISQVAASASFPQLTTVVYNDVVVL